MIVIDIGNTNTGGLAITFKDPIEMKCYLEPHLTLLGLYLIGLKKNE